MSQPAATRPYPIDRIRADFPILATTMRGKPLVYLDNGATSLKPQVVIDAELDYLTRISANIHRGVYQLSEEATVKFDEARASIREFINAGDEGEVVFTKSATESSNLVAFGWGRKFLNPGDEIVLTELEHHANLIPWQQVATATGAQLRFVPLDPFGRVTVEAVESVMSEKTRVIAITGMSNVTGHLPPLREISRVAHKRSAVVVVDGAQLVSHHPVDVQALGCDFISFSGHKMCGPTGVGALYGKKELLEAMDPLLYGGDMIVRVRKESATFKGIPDKFETGTPNISGVIGFGAAVRYLQGIGMDAIAAHEQDLLVYATRRVGEVPTVTLYGPMRSDAGGSGVAMPGGMLSFNLGDIHPHDVGAILDGEGVAVRTGFHCAQPLMQFFGVPGTVRASFYLYNTVEDIDTLVGALHKALEVFT
jgi:cysteine desulfurase / selenocysteine lyase